jgi:flavin-dependent dehydrogenase
VLPAADVAIIGAGPAGAAAAIRLARRGWHVVLLDRASFPRAKVCGEAIGPAAVRHLDELGVWQACRDAGAWPHGSLLLHAPDGSRIPCPYPDGQPGWSMSRLDLDTLLVAFARVVGVEVQERWPVTDLQRRQDLWTLEGPALRQARAVIVAAGRHHHLRSPSQRPRRSRRIVLVAPVTGVAGLGSALEMVLPGDASPPALIAPQGLNEASVALIFDGVRPPTGTEGFLNALRRLPGHGERFEQAETLAPVRGMAIRNGRTDRPVFDGGMAAGDAYGCIDPITGHGITLALQSGIQAADSLDIALRVGRLDARFLQLYAEAMDPHFLPQQHFAALTVWLTRHPRLAGALLRRLGGHPGLCADLAAIQGGLRPADLVWPLLQQVVLARVAA